MRAASMNYVMGTMLRPPRTSASRIAASGLSKEQLARGVGNEPPNRLR
jgi:hypothetical protein